jgi:hypothetical protein
MATSEPSFEEVVGSDFAELEDGLRAAAVDHERERPAPAEDEEEVAAGAQRVEGARAHTQGRAVFELIHPDAQLDIGLAIETPSHATFRLTIERQALLELFESYDAVMDHGCDAAGLELAVFVKVLLELMHENHPYGV